MHTAAPNQGYLYMCTTLCTDSTHYRSSLFSSLASTTRYGALVPTSLQPTPFAYRVQQGLNFRSTSKNTFLLCPSTLSSTRYYSISLSLNHFNISSSSPLQCRRFTRAFFALRLPALHLSQHNRSPMDAPRPQFQSVPAAAFSSRGKPSYQQDRHLVHHHPSASIFAVADGHGEPRTGHLVAEHCVAALPALLDKHGALAFPNNDAAASDLLEPAFESAIAALDKSSIRLTAESRVYAGSTLVTVVRHPSHLVCANVGDSRAILLRCEPRGQRPSVLPLSRDHLCDTGRERARIEKAGGVVVGGLLNGYISMSRAVGDEDLKENRNHTAFPYPGQRPYDPSLFTSEPDVTVTRVHPNTDAMVVLASDGVWNNLSNDMVAASACKSVLDGGSALEVARSIVKRALRKGSKDNVTAVVAFLFDAPEVRRMMRMMNRKMQSMSTGDLQMRKVPSNPMQSFLSLSNSGDAERSVDIASLERASALPQPSPSPRRVRSTRFLNGGVTEVGREGKEENRSLFRRKTMSVLKTRRPTNLEGQS